MKCKAIELLEVLLEETSEKHGQIYEMISRDLDEIQLKTVTKELHEHVRQRNVICSTSYI